MVSIFTWSCVFCIECSRTTNQLILCLHEIELFCISPSPATVQYLHRTLWSNSWFFLRCKYCTVRNEPIPTHNAERVELSSWKTWGFYAGDGDVVWHVAAWCPTFVCVFFWYNFLKVLLMPSILMLRGQKWGLSISIQIMMPKWNYLLRANEFFYISTRGT